MVNMSVGIVKYNMELNINIVVPSLMLQTVYPAHSGYHGAPELIFETGSVFLTSCHAPIRVTFLAISRPSLPTLGAYSTVEIIRITTKLGLTMI